MKFVRLFIAGRVAIIDLSKRSDAEVVLISKVLEDLLPTILKLHATAEAITRRAQSQSVESACIEGLRMEYNAFNSAVSDLSAKVNRKELPSNVALFDICMKLGLMTT
jgi:hypothetical protein